MAPDTSERTAFKKNAGANTVAIVYAEFLYVEYDSVHLMLTNFLNQLYHSDKQKSNSF